MASAGDPLGPPGSRAHPDTPGDGNSGINSPVVLVVLALANNLLERPHSEEEMAGIVAYFEAEHVTHVSREDHFRVCLLTPPGNVVRIYS